MRKLIGTLIATGAVSATMAVSAAPAGAQDLIEYALMAGFVSVAADSPPPAAAEAPQARSEASHYVDFSWD
jgi:hypothetical protein